MSVAPATEHPADKPRIFIGSSVEGLKLARAIQFNLDHFASCTIWYQGVFGLSDGPLESLVKALGKFHFAILVLTPDDVTTKRKESKNSPRDNVLFELGLFIGAFGRERTFTVHCREDKLELPSDMAGIKPATFAKRPDGDLAGALGAACYEIEQAIAASPPARQILSRVAGA